MAARAPGPQAPAQPDNAWTEWEGVDLDTGRSFSIRHRHRTELGAAMQLHYEHPEFWDIDLEHRVIRRKESA